MIKNSLLILSSASLLAASTTMCYKKNHLDPSTIGSVVLDGGKCDGKYSLEDMKQQGYSVENLKLQNATDGLSYIYVLTKKDETSQKIVTSSITNDQLKTQLKAINEEKELKKEQEETQNTLKEGEKLYNATCKRCHGDGSIAAYNSSRPLNDLSLEDMQIAIRDYSNGSKDNGMAMVMTPYANSITSNELESVYNYLQTLK